MPFVKDAVLVIEPGMTGATGNVYCGLHEFADMALALHFLRPGDLFLDVGANIGSYTILAGKVAGADCVSIEPVPQTFERLQRNIKINNLEQSVQAYPCAVGASQGTIRFSTDQDTTNRVVEKDYLGQSLAVPVRTIDSLVSTRAATMWKIDVEGFEREALAGAGGSLRDPALNVVLLESDGPELNATMTSCGFTRCGYEPFSRTAKVVERNGPVQNNLWVRDIDALEARCRCAPKLTILGLEV
jgi:FkbM family methyltransferase